MFIAVSSVRSWRLKRKTLRFCYSDKLLTPKGELLKGFSSHQPELVANPGHYAMPGYEKFCLHWSGLSAMGSIFGHFWLRKGSALFLIDLKTSVSLPLKSLFLNSISVFFFFCFITSTSCPLKPSWRFQPGLKFTTASDGPGFGEPVLTWIKFVKFQPTGAGHPGYGGSPQIWRVTPVMAGHPGYGGSPRISKWITWQEGYPR